LGGRGRQISEFEDSMVYRVSSRTARATQRNPVSKTKQNKTKQNKKTKNNNKTLFRCAVSKFSANTWIVSCDAALESRSVTVFIPGKKFGDDFDQQMTFPIQCSFWSFVDMDSSSRRNVQKTSTLIGQMVRALTILLLEYC
jgi:hypothetical protein